MKSIKNTLLLVMAIIALGGISSTTAFACSCEPGTGTPGYWKNHPDEWPVEEICVGGLLWKNCEGGQIYPKDDAIAIMNSPVRGDTSKIMFRALVAAKLNQLASGCDCVPTITYNGDEEECIHSAHWWLGTFPVGSGVSAKSEAWQASHGEALYWCLDDYNNGLFPCAPSRDVCENSL